MWFVGIAAGQYKPIYPVWIVADEPDRLQFAIALDQGQRLITPGDDVGADTRRYMRRSTGSGCTSRCFVRECWRPTSRAAPCVS